MLKDKLNSVVLKVKEIDKRVVVKAAVIGVAILLAVGLTAYAVDGSEEPELLEEPGDEYFESEEQEEEVI